MAATTCCPNRLHAPVDRAPATVRTGSAGPSRLVRRPTLTSPGPRHESARAQVHTACPPPSGRSCSAKSHAFTARTPAPRSDVSAHAWCAQAGRAAPPVASRGCE
ncbi:hypothetical protein AB0D38_20150 [Streptomyces sp. NPDC048279]|uniref:hypothetical protein n=1 Tax=Streptomyces sp. NPDC048279 TaxID=3154714 RepID=UPI00341C4E4E